jgi:hypothetical protein
MKNFTSIKNWMAFSFLLMSGTAMAQTNLLSNPSFEEWSGSEPAHWVSTTTAGNGTISQAADARTGSSSILLKGTSSNKRLASEEMTLKAGTYIFSIYAKAATEENASARPGYAPVNEDGSMGNYAYGVYHNDITNAKWVLVADTFTLDADTKLNLVVMNPKNPGKDILLDDASLTTEDGGIVDDGGAVDPEPAENVLFETSFDDENSGFEFKDVELGGLTYVWKADTKFGCLKASAFANNTNNVAESWAVSPAIDLSEVSKATLTFRHAMNYVKAGEPKDYASVWVSTDYAGDVATATWTELTIATYPSGSNWTFVEAGDIDLTAYCGKKVYIAYKYVSTTAAAPTWEVDNMKVVAPVESGISSVENAENAPVEVYTLNGVKVGSSLDGLKSGIYLVKKGNKVQKVLK